MKINRFVNQIAAASLHSSGLSAGTPNAAQPQSFTARMNVERSRKVIQTYRSSLVGGHYAERGEIRPTPRPSPQPSQGTTSRQGFNAGTDVAPPPTPRRSYDPYGQ